VRDGAGRHPAPYRGTDLGGIDALKLRLCATLFRRAVPSASVFQRVLDEYFGGVADAATDRLL